VVIILINIKYSKVYKLLNLYRSKVLIMTTKNDVNRLFAEVMEYAKATTTQNVVSTIQQNAQQSNLLSNVSKTIDQTMTDAYNNTAGRFQAKLNELEQAINEKHAAAKPQKKTSVRGRQSSRSKK
jgi:hypothetical protein